MVFCLSSGPSRRVNRRQCVELMIAGDPDDVLEKGTSSLEGKGELLGGFADVTAKNEAVVWMW